MAMNEDILLKLHQLSDSYFHLLPIEILYVIIDKQYDILISPTFEQLYNFIKYVDIFEIHMLLKCDIAIFKSIKKVNIAPIDDNNNMRIIKINVQDNDIYDNNIYHCLKIYDAQIPYIHMPLDLLISDEDIASNPGGCCFIERSYTLDTITLYRY
jgi:hypothetical protein